MQQKWQVLQQPKPFARSRALCRWSMGHRRSSPEHAACYIRPCLKTYTTLRHILDDEDHARRTRFTTHAWKICRTDSVATDRKGSPADCWLAASGCTKIIEIAPPTIVPTDSRLSSKSKHPQQLRFAGLAFQRVAPTHCYCSRLGCLARERSMTYQIKPGPRQKKEDGTDERRRHVD